jgi:hypothetical protein
VLSGPRSLGRVAALSFVLGDFMGSQRVRDGLDACALGLDLRWRQRTWGNAETKSKIAKALGLEQTCSSLEIVLIERHLFQGEKRDYFNVVVGELFLSYELANGPAAVDGIVEATRDEHGVASAPR